MMDALDVERYGPARALARELAPRDPWPPPPVRARRATRPVATDQTWEQYRAAFAQAARLADARLAEAQQAGTDDPWWEEPDA